MFENKNLITLIFLILSLISNSQSLSEQYNTIIKFQMIEQQLQDKNLFINLVLQAQSKSLQQSLNQLDIAVQQVKTLSYQNCLISYNGSSYQPNYQTFCNTQFQLQKVQIQPRFTKSKTKNLKLKNYKVTQQASIKVQDIKNIGLLTAKLQNIQGLTIQFFDWSPDQNQDSMIQTIQKGKQKAHIMCKSIGQKLKKIIKIQHYYYDTSSQSYAEQSQEIQDFDEKQIQKQNQEQNNFDTLQVEVFEFQVQCQQ